MLQSIVNFVSSAFGWVVDLVKKVIAALSFSNPVNAVYGLLGYAMVLTAAQMGMGFVLRAIVWLVLAIGMIARDLWTHDERVTETNVLNSLVSSLPMHAGALVGMVVASVL